MHPFSERFLELSGSGSGVVCRAQLNASCLEKCAFACEEARGGQETYLSTYSLNPVPGREVLAPPEPMLACYALLPLHKGLLRKAKSRRRR